MIIKHYKDVEPVVPSDPDVKGVQMRILIGEQEDAPNFIMRLFSVSPKGHTPYHSHAWEHEVFVISGEGEAKTKEHSCKIGPGSVVYVPPYEEHQFINTSDEELVFLCIVPRK